MQWFSRVVVLPSVLGALLGVASPAAHADCACISPPRLLSPRDIPGDICPDEDTECDGRFLPEGTIVLRGSEILLDVYPSDGPYRLEPAP